MADFDSLETHGDAAKASASSRIPSPDERVCPDCGNPTGSGSFCEQCGLNLAAIERLPTRAQWERGEVLARDAEAQAIADHLATIDPFSPGLFDVAPAERRLDAASAVTVIERATRRAVEDRVPRRQRSAAFVVHVASRPPAGERLSLTASVTLGGGRRVEQDFICSHEAGKPRARVTPVGPARLVTGNEDVGALAQRTPFGAAPPVPTPSPTSDSPVRSVAFARQTAAASHPAGWYLNPTTGMRQWWDGRQWGPIDPGAQPARVASPQGTNGLAIASLVLGIVWLWGLGSLLALIFGVIAQAQCDEREQQGRGLATAGVVLGIVGLLGLLLIIIIARSATP